MENSRSPPSHESGIREELKIPRESGIRSDGSERGQYPSLPVVAPVVVGPVVVVAQPGEEPRECAPWSSRLGS